MPAKKKKGVSIDEDTLIALKKKGVSNTLLDCRLEYAEASTLLNNFIAPLTKQYKVFPQFLPTQASGRWSTTNPPITNFPKECCNPQHEPLGKHRPQKGCYTPRDVVVPDPGTYWIHFDWDAIEAKLVAAFSHDKADLEAFSKGYDIHTITACKMWGIPLPPILTKACHTLPECEEWRGLWVPVWEGGDDRRRTIGKIARYGCNYGPNEYAILNAKGLDELNLSHEEALQAGRMYLDSKPNLREWKFRTWARVLKDRQARTAIGRPRRLFVAEKDVEMWIRRKMPPEVAREGLNHEVQGTVADAMNLTIIKIVERWPQAGLCQQLHDGLVMSFPNNVKVWPEIREICEPTHKINGYPIKFTGEFERILSSGEKEHL